MKTDTNDSANGYAENIEKPDYDPNWGYVYKWKNHRGLTKREHFAAMAMQAIISKTPLNTYPQGKCHDPNDLNNQIARGAVDYADSLIKALNAELPKGK